MRSIATSISRTTTRCWVCGDKPQLFKPTPTGYAQSAASIGPAILWAPFFGAGHLVARSLQAHHPDIDANGISFPYRQAVCVAGLFYGLIGCWFCFRLTRRFYDASLAALATASAISGSFLLWYLVKEPSMTHGPSMAAVAGFAWAWIATRDTRINGAQTVNGTSASSNALRQWAWLGAIAGFMTLIRWQNALFAVLPACDAIVGLWAAARASDRARARRVLAGGVLFTLCAVIAFVPADDRLARDLRIVARRVAARATDSLGGSQTRRYPLVVAQRAFQLVAHPLCGRNRARDVRRYAAERRGSDASGHCPDDVLQRVYPGLVGQRRIRRAPIRRDDPVLLSRRRGAGILCRESDAPPSAASGRGRRALFSFCGT